MTEAQPEQRRVTISDPQVMRALAHPARLAIVEHLSFLGGRGASATECAEVAGLSPSATSYHLRALAKFGLVEEAPGRGDARERLWRTRNPSFLVDAGQSAGPEARAAEQALIEAHNARDAARARDWLRRAGDEPREWYEVAVFNNSMLLVTAEEQARLNAEFERLVEPYRHRNRAADPPPGARRVGVQYRVVPLD
ncbi:ArsR/SmtB family transcription factor [Micromonospora echinofusca]|uniref:Helix-turn-helix domain-containing protein n=1 Tax=Micromonospora echinofusca TaxID=47858 RepID=A0ABS3VT18_MICEH|nr:helix-turn-helix domain-containing protein [Micromonospora echinofusca]MBO4207544.1 helix-turn-helix domain-containing protein [Micromonospora echinofusca]